ncbi:MAG: permease [Halococcoides sp.]
MATEADDLPENVLIEYYRRFFGEPDEYVDVYAGFGLFFVGIAFGAIALVAFLVSTTAEPNGALYYSARKAGFSVGMVGVPLVMVGVIVLLPVERKAIAGGALGTAITLVATGLFYWAYPYHFNIPTNTRPDYSGPIVLIYALGLAVLFAATAAALIAYLIASQKPTPAEIQAPEDEEDDEESYSDEEIREDIETAMEGVDLTWGGVEKHEGTALQLNVDMGDADLSGMQVEAERTTSDRGVDDQVSGLTSMKAGDAKTATSESTVDDQTAALNDLRERKRAEEAGETPSQPVGRLSDVTDRVSRLGPVETITERARSLIGKIR